MLNINNNNLPFLNQHEQLQWLIGFYSSEPVSETWWKLDEKVENG